MNLYVKRFGFEKVSENVLRLEKEEMTIEIYKEEYVRVTTFERFEGEKVSYFEFNNCWDILDFFEEELELERAVGQTYFEKL